MKKLIFLVVILLAIIAVSGCVSQEDVIKNLAKQTDLAKDFLKDNPNAEIVVVKLSADDVSSIIDEIRSKCGPQMQVKAYWKVSINDPDTQSAITSWIDADTQELLCTYRISTATTTTSTTQTTTTISNNCLSAQFRLYSGTFDNSTDDLYLILENQRSVSLELTDLELYYSNNIVKTKTIGETLRGNGLKTVKITDVDDNFERGIIKTNCLDISVEFTYSQLTITVIKSKMISILDHSCSAEANAHVITLVVSNDGDADIASSELIIYVDDVDHSNDFGAYSGGTWNANNKNIAAHATKSISNNDVVTWDPGVGVHEVLVKSPSNTQRTMVLCTVTTTSTIPTTTTIPVSLTCTHTCDRGVEITSQQYQKNGFDGYEHQFLATLKNNNPRNCGMFCLPINGINFQPDEGEREDLITLPNVGGYNVVTLRTNDLSDFQLVCSEVKAEEMGCDNRIKQIFEVV